MKGCCSLVNKVWKQGACRDIGHWFTKHACRDIGHWCTKHGCTEGSWSLDTFTKPALGVIEPDSNLPA